VPDKKRLDFRQEKTISIFQFQISLSLRLGFVEEGG
jgi:hypothetical protein